MKSVALNKISENFYDFGISSDLYFSFNLSKNVSFSPNYYQSILNKTNVTYAGFYNPNVINKLIQNGNTHLKFFKDIKMCCIYLFCLLK